MYAGYKMFTAKCDTYKKQCFKLFMVQSMIGICYNSKIMVPLLLHETETQTRLIVNDKDTI